MPVCYITISDEVEKKERVYDKIDAIRDIIAAGLNSKSRLLDRFHIAVRIQESNREFMLGELEIDIYAQFFFRRYFTRDLRANRISSNVSKLLGVDCATWINLCQVGYSRYTKSGDSFYSVKEDDVKVLERQKSANTKN